MIHTVLLLLFIYGCAYIHVFLHERGHAEEMLKQRIIPKALTIGMPIPFLTFLRIRFSHPKVLNGLTITVYPLLLAGAVWMRPFSVIRLEKRNFESQALIYSAGIWANVFYSSLPIIFYEMWKGSMKTMFIYIGIAALCLFGKKPVMVYLLPFLSITVGGYLLPTLFVRLFLTKPNPNQTFVYDIGQTMQTGMAFEGALQIALSTGMVLAAMNLLPIMPLDGGKLVYALIGRKSARLATLFSFATVIIMLGIIANIAITESWAILKIFH